MDGSGFFDQAFGPFIEVLQKKDLASEAKSNAIRALGTMEGRRLLRR